MLFSIYIIRWINYALFAAGLFGMIYRIETPYMLEVGFIFALVGFANTRYLIMSMPMVYQFYQSMDWKWPIPVPDQSVIDNGFYEMKANRRKRFMPLYLLGSFAILTTSFIILASLISIYVIIVGEYAIKGMIVFAAFALLYAYIFLRYIYFNFKAIKYTVNSPFIENDEEYEEEMN